MIRLFACAAFLSLPQLAAAANTQACLTRQEVGTMMLFVAPTVIETAAQKCSATLPASSFLRGDGHKRMAGAIRAEIGADPKAMKVVVEKVAGERLPEGVNEETFRTMMEEVIGAEFAKELKVEDCPVIDELASALSPLPAKNIGTIIGTIVAMGAADKKAPFKLCTPS